jgi:hypothetical protein
VESDNPLQIISNVLKAVSTNQAFDLGFDALWIYYFVHTVPLLDGWLKFGGFLFGACGILFSLQTNKKLIPQGNRSKIKNVTPGQDALTDYSRHRFIEDLKRSPSASKIADEKSIAQKKKKT